ncbi:hypothetical protein KQH56_01395 [bacterium]|nr:hypothetical protein [bacterium]
MNKRTLIVFVGIICLFLFLGLVLFKMLNQNPVNTVLDGGFRVWFWDNKAMDLVIQVTLVFAGALGISAILPEGENDDPS